MTKNIIEYDQTYQNMKKPKRIIDLENSIELDKLYVKNMVLIKCQCLVCL